MEKLSELTRTRLHNAFGADGVSSGELADNIDNLNSLTDGQKYVGIGLQIATAADHTDAISIGLKVGDKVALVNTTGQTVQTITTDNEFASVPAIGDLIIAQRPVS